MKIALLFLLTMPAFAVNAQNIARKYDYINTVADHIPTHGGKPYYDTSVTAEATIEREQAETRVQVCFQDVIASDLVKKLSKSTTTAACQYTFSIKNSTDPNDQYTVSYWADLTVKSKSYTVEFHDFTIDFQGYELDISKKIDAAKNGDGNARQVLALFHSHNVQLLKKTIATLVGTSSEGTTASK